MDWDIQDDNDNDNVEVVQCYRCNVVFKDIQDDNDDVKVMVSGDYSCKDDDEPRTDFLIIDKISGEHKHISIDQYGNETEHHGYK